MTAQPTQPLSLNYNSINSLNPSSNIKNLINITSLNIQGNDNHAKIHSISLSLNPRSIFCCSKTKLSTNKLLPKRLNNCYRICSVCRGFFVSADYLFVFKLPNVA